MGYTSYICEDSGRLASGRVRKFESRHAAPPSHAVDSRFDEFISRFDEFISPLLAS